MKKILLSIPILLLLITGVFAYSPFTKVKASEGDIHYLVNDRDFISSKVNFKALSYEDFGLGSFSLKAKTSSGEKVNLKVYFTQVGTIRDDDEVLYLTNNAIATYHKQGEKKVDVSCRYLRYYVDKLRNKVHVEGKCEQGIVFKVNQLDAKIKN